MITSGRSRRRGTDGRAAAPSRWHTRPGWWQQRAAANAALAVRDFVTRAAGGTADTDHDGRRRTPDELLIALSAGLAAVLDLHHPDQRGTCTACSRTRWAFRVRWPCPLLRTLTRELDRATDPATGYPTEYPTGRATDPTTGHISGHTTGHTTGRTAGRATGHTTSQATDHTTGRLT